MFSSMLFLSISTFLGTPYILLPRGGLGPEGQAGDPEGPSEEATVSQVLNEKSLTLLRSGGRACRQREQHRRWPRGRIRLVSSRKEKRLVQPPFGGVWGEGGAELQKAGRTPVGQGPVGQGERSACILNAAWGAREGLSRGWGRVQGSASDLFKVKLAAERPIDRGWEWGHLTADGRETNGEAASHSGQGHACLGSSAFTTPDPLPGSLRGAPLSLPLQEGKLRLREVNLPAQGPSTKAAEVGLEPRSLNPQPGPPRHLRGKGQTVRPRPSLRAPHAIRDPGSNAAPTPGRRRRL